MFYHMILYPKKKYSQYKSGWCVISLEAPDLIQSKSDLWKTGKPVIVSETGWELTLTATCSGLGSPGIPTASPS